MSRNADPLQDLLRLPQWHQLRRKLQHLLNPNRAAGWITGLSLLLVLLGLGYLLLRQETPPLLQVDGVYYAQTGHAVRTIPKTAEQIGSLLHVTREETETMGSWSGSGLPRAWVGNPIYAETPLRQVLYLATDEGFQPFVPEPPPKLPPGVQPWALSQPRPEVVLAEFPRTVFRWDGRAMLAVTDYGTEELFRCDGDDEIWFADLNGDGRREICGAILSDESVTHRKVVAYDWADRIFSALDAPRVWDYTLTLRDFRLYVRRWHFQGEEPQDEVPLILEGDTLTADWTW